MHQRKNGIHADVCLFVAGIVVLAAFFAVEFYTRIRPGLMPPRPIVRLAVIALLCAELYCAALLRVRRTGQNRIFFSLMQVFFILYLYLLLTFTLSDGHLGRLGIDMTREEYLALRVNYIPLATVKLYIRAFMYEYVGVQWTALNLIGNICAFMPFAFFLPGFFRLQRKWYVFLPTVLLFVCAIEGMQFAFMVGSCDVDDLILNAGGSFLLYLLFLIPPAKRFCNRLFTGDWKFTKATDAF